MASNKEMRKIAREAKKSGFAVDRTRNGHYRISAANGDAITISFSPGTDASERDSIHSYRKFKERHAHG